MIKYMQNAVYIRACIIIMHEQSKYSSLTTSEPWSQHRLKREGLAKKHPRGAIRVSPRF